MRLVRSWWAAASGNVGVAFALAIIPLCAVLGIAIDYLRASNLRNVLQGAVDAAVLAAGAEGGNDEAALRNTIALYMDANLSAHTKAAVGAIRNHLSQAGDDQGRGRGGIAERASQDRRPQ